MNKKNITLVHFNYATKMLMLILRNLFRIHEIILIESKQGVYN